MVYLYSVRESANIYWPWQTNLVKRYLTHMKYSNKKKSFIPNELCPKLFGHTYYSILLLRKTILHPITPVKDLFYYLRNIILISLNMNHSTISSTLYFIITLQRMLYTDILIPKYAIDLTNYYIAYLNPYILWIIQYWKSKIKDYGKYFLLHSEAVVKGNIIRYNDGGQLSQVLKQHVLNVVADFSMLRV